MLLGFRFHAAAGMQFI